MSLGEFGRSITLVPWVPGVRLNDVDGNPVCTGCARMPPQSGALWCRDCPRLMRAWFVENGKGRPDSQEIWVPDAIRAIRAGWNRVFQGQFQLLRDWDQIVLFDGGNLTVQLSDFQLQPRQSPGQLRSDEPVMWLAYARTFTDKMPQLDLPLPLSDARIERSGELWLTVDTGEERVEEIPAAAPVRADERIVFLQAEPDREMWRRQKRPHGYISKPHWFEWWFLEAEQELHVLVGDLRPEVRAELVTDELRAKCRELFARLMLGEDIPDRIK